VGFWAFIAALLIAQEPPVPPAPEEEKKAEEIAPGFEEETEKPPKKPKTRAEAQEDPEAPDLPPLSTSPGDNERLIADINAARGEVTLAELVDEVLADVMAELDRLPAKEVSPLAIRKIDLTPNVSPRYANKLRNHIIAQLHAGTEIKVVRCIECDATNTRIEGGQWLITRGVVTTDEMKAIGDKIGAKTFLDVTFGFDTELGLVEMDFQLVRVRDAAILWAESFRADESTPVLMRSSEAPIRRKDRLEDLEMLLQGRPYYGIQASAGFMLIPYNDPVGGDIPGGTAGFRVYERFGVERRVMFGLDLMGFINTSRLPGGILSAGAWWSPLRPDLINPELRIGAKAGAFIAGSRGNAAMFQLGAEVLLRYRFGLYLYALYMTKAVLEDPNQLGGVGMSAGLSFNW
jgi:hypothetical protein